jgi:hypothetical protein
MRSALLAAAAALLVAGTATAGDAPPFFRGAYVMPQNRPVYRMAATTVYVNGQAVGRAYPAGYAAVYPRYVDRPGVIRTASAEAFYYYPVPAYPVLGTTPSESFGR